MPPCGHVGYGSDRTVDILCTVYDAGGKHGSQCALPCGTDGHRITDSGQLQLPDEFEPAFPVLLIQRGGIDHYESPGALHQHHSSAAAIGRHQRIPLPGAEYAAGMAAPDRASGLDCGSVCHLLYQLYEKGNTGAVGRQGAVFRICFVNYLLNPPVFSFENQMYKNMYMFSEKHVRLFSETRTRIYENTYVFFQKDDGDIQAIRILYNKPNNQLFFKV